jgi:hypothetical protein
MSLIISVLLIAVIIAGPMFMYWRNHIMKWRCPRCGNVYYGRINASDDGAMCSPCHRTMMKKYDALKSRVLDLKRRVPVTPARPTVAPRAHAAPYGGVKTTPLRNDETAVSNQVDLMFGAQHVWASPPSPPVDTERQFAGGGGNFGGAGASGGWDSGSSSSSDSGSSSSSDSSSSSSGGD